MTLWCVFGSPLMLGADLTALDERTASLLTNRRVLDLLDPTRQRCQVRRTGEEAVWASRSPEGCLCAALFNLSDRERTVSVSLEELGVPSGTVPAEELWTGERFSAADGALTASLPAHGCALLQAHHNK